jgi:hypothetical protein
MKSFATVTTPILLPRPVRGGLEAATRALFGRGDQFSADFFGCPEARAVKFASPPAATPAAPPRGFKRLAPLCCLHGEALDYPETTANKVR